jgi:hypothetical protein
MEGVQECGTTESVITCERRSRKTVLTNHFILSFIICILDLCFGMTRVGNITCTGHVTSMGKVKCLQNFRWKT